MICIAVTYVIKPGHEAEAERLFGILAEETRKEPGCQMYVAHRSTANPRQYFLYEQYDNQAALDYHRASAHFDQYGKNGLILLAESRSPEIYQPL